LEPEIIRLILIVGMFGITGISDIKSREFEDKLLIPFIIVGILTYVLELPSLLDMVLIGIGIGFSISIWYFKLVAVGDLFGLLITAAFIPELFFQFLAVSLSISVLYTVGKNYKINKSFGNAETVFAEYHESLLKKKLGYFLFHKNINEKFTFPAATVIEGKKKFLFTINAESDFVHNNELVAYTLPMMFFFFCGASVLLFTNMMI